MLCPLVLNGYCVILFFGSNVEHDKPKQDFVKCIIFDNIKTQVT